MNNKVLILAMVSILFLAMSSVAQEVATLSITATNFKNENGQAVVNLFREQDDLPKKPFMTSQALIKAGSAKLVFENLRNGSYAIIAYHDENDNGTLDHKLGFPNEPMGFSNSWNLSLFSGMATFKKLRFEYGGQHTEIQVKID